MKRYIRSFSLAIPFLLVGIAALVACDFTQEGFNIHQALSNSMNDLHLGLIPVVLLGCTRAIYVANEETKSIFTMRSMDWADPNMSISLWASPRNSYRTGVGESDEGYPLTWESKYKSLVVCNYGKSTTDGINEEGLVANLLFLAQADYTHDEQSNKPRLPISGLAQYVLDNYANVQEAVDGLKEEPFFIVTSDIALATLDRENSKFKVSTKNIVLHLSISDSQGNSAVLQYVTDEQTKKSKLVVYHFQQDKKDKGKDTVSVMTNSLYEEQLELLKRFQNEDGEFDWAGKNKSFSWDKLMSNSGFELTPPMNGANIRFLRASFYSNRMDKIDNNYQNQRPFIDETNRVLGNPESYSIWVDKWSQNEGVARAFSLIRNLSTPLNIQGINNNPFLSSTLWRTVIDHKKNRYFFESTRGLCPLYVDLDEFFKDLETVKKLDILLSPTKKGDQGIDLLEDQLNKGIKIGKVNHEFVEVEDNKWFYFDYQKS
ncbi:penicillin amidase [Cylindrospermum stagnale PCC 7417]|uniref:Penicillin amidase n=1 Tax=Cylindrospermum stagnale PCC 7417 TaxID=56107 RepID=K9X583_9NOST|nr:linear amide C-N hydrolase [Cylindrospermum stagnale]AFZ26817.1 penicillin amidase [Cylindrospermum stagnale PCC 7417]